MNAVSKLPRQALASGTTLHWYAVERVLGQGGFGITYLARDTNLDRPVAIKEYLPLELAARDAASGVQPATPAHAERYDWGLDRFIAEARTLARFEHPAIVRVLSVFEANGTAYMVMEYQHGESLQQVLERQRTLDQAELERLLGPLLDGLEVIHGQGFVHRDIKPANIYVRGDGQPVLLDFGSARQALGEHTQTLTSVVSPGYAPFEQYYSRGDRQGRWTDIYSLAATLYRCLAGVAPMPAIDRSEAILKTQRDVLVSARSLGAGRYAPALLAAIDHGLAFDEEARPRSVAAWRVLFQTTSPAPLTVSALDDEAPTRLHARDGAPLREIDTAVSVRNTDARREALVRRREASRAEGHGGAWLLAVLAGSLCVVGLLYWLGHGGAAHAPGALRDWLPALASPTMRS